MYDFLLSFENPTKWSKAIYEKCGPEAIEGAFQARSLADFGVTAVPLGAFYGMVCQQRFTPGILYGKVPESEAWYKKLFRIATAILLCVPIIGIGKGIQSYLGVDKPYYNLIFGRMIPSLLFGFVLFFVTDIFNKKIGLLKL